ncbi:Uncharacterised protein [Chryseobacterium gleum]|uniref:Uncharacterized protein n=2 Tax=Chryseobacterium gleum TaxID=250 RepID=A0A3S5E366_CHRGE|nr:hypothetical protein [Chryseobacterium gleum]EFK36777.1 hypothetical protein HMPREF0204_11334 [Chryseobacterium gleum ATCC 35910]QQY32033.1 hypothetical protein I6I60_24925 [Chryseobacterium gleum]VEE10746.1 Uncharacterised protein [Chryseobacterium gleum]
MEEYQELFNYMSNEHNVTLLQQDMDEIIRIVKKIQLDKGGNTIIDTKTYLEMKNSNESIPEFKEVIQQYIYEFDQFDLSYSNVKLAKDLLKKYNTTH